MLRFIKNILDPLNVLGMVRNIPERTITLTTVYADPAIAIQCAEAFAIHTIKNGAHETQSFTDMPSLSIIALQADAGSEIVIDGNISTFVIGNINGEDYSDLDVSNCESLIYLEIDDIPTLASVDTSHNDGLLFLELDSVPNIASIDVSHNIMLYGLSIKNCPLIASVDTTANTLLRRLGLYDLPLVTSIDVSQNDLEHLLLENLPLTSLDVIHTSHLYYTDFTNLPDLTFLAVRGTEQGATNDFAQLITDATSTTGTLRTVATDQYYSTLATAATNKGWNIETVII